MNFFKESCIKARFDYAIQNSAPSQKMKTFENPSLELPSLDDVHQNSIQTVTYQYFIPPNSESFIVKNLSVDDTQVHHFEVFPFKKQLHVYSGGTENTYALHFPGAVAQLVFTIKILFECDTPQELRIKFEDGDKVYRWWLSISPKYKNYEFETSYAQPHKLDIVQAPLPKMQPQRVHQPSLQSAVQPKTQPKTQSLSPKKKAFELPRPSKSILPTLDPVVFSQSKQPTAQLPQMLKIFQEDAQHDGSKMHNKKSVKDKTNAIFSNRIDSRF